MAAAGRLAARHIALAERLLLGATTKTAAEHLGVSERTVRRWRADPAFQRRMSEMAAEAVEEAHRATTASYRPMLAVLVSIASDASQEPRTRSIAARAVVQAFTALQPKHVQQDIEVHDTPAVHYTIDGVDPELLR
jgi:hypothetical protein